MTILAGERLTAARLNRLQPKTYLESATGTVAASQADVAVPGCSIAFNTEADNAKVLIRWAASFYATGATGLGSCRAFLDGVGAPDFAVAQQSTNGEKHTVGMEWEVAVPSAGPHTAVLQATTSAGQTISPYSFISVTVTETV